MPRSKAADYPPGENYIFVGPCNDNSDCTELCKVKKIYIPKYGVKCVEKIPPYPTGPPNDCFCRVWSYNLRFDDELSSSVGLISWGYDLEIILNLYCQMVTFKPCAFLK